jgi:coiled-coil domain-containing protein 55
VWFCAMSREKEVPLIGEEGVQYGLQQPRQPRKQKGLGIFGAVSDDEAPGAPGRNAAIRAQQGGISRTDAKVRQMQAMALEEDANCFEYDAFFDDMQTERDESKKAKFEADKAAPRYLGAMLQARDHRNRMRDISYQRREALAAKAEEDAFEGKERFATAAYKKKMEEDRLFMEEQEAKCDNRSY